MYWLFYCILCKQFTRIIELANFPIFTFTLVTLSFIVVFSFSSNMFGTVHSGRVKVLRSFDTLHLKGKGRKRTNVVACQILVNHISNKCDFRVGDSIALSFRVSISREALRTRDIIIINSWRERSIIVLCAQVLQHLNYFIEARCAWLQLSFIFILLLSKTIQDNSSYLLTNLLIHD